MTEEEGEEIMFYLGLGTGLLLGGCFGMLLMGLIIGGNSENN